MIINCIILVFCGFMIVWWASQGFFSSLLQLIVVITAGACTLGLWEPLMMNFLIRTMPFHARGVAFMSLFVLFMVFFRALFDSGVRQNVHFNQAVNFIGGGFCGMLLGILTGGMMLIGLSFLPVSAELIDYQAYIVGGDGKVAEKDHLWFPIDRWTIGFYNTLSTGSFATDTPLRNFTPDLVQQASLFRMRNDPNSSVVVIPDSVEIQKVFWENGPQTLGGKVDVPAGNMLVGIQTKWKKTAGTYDGDSTLRLPPAQIRLITDGTTSDSTSELEAPIAYSYLDPQDEFRYFYAVDSDDQSAYANNDSADFTFFFSIPADRVPRFFLARLTRFALPDPAHDGTSLAALVGGTKVDVRRDPNGIAIPETPTKDLISITTDIPLNPRSKNALTGEFEFEEDAMVRGKGEMRPPEGVIPRGVQVTHIKTPKQQACVKYRFTREKAREVLGAAIASANSLDSISIRDNLSNVYLPIGWAWVKSNGTSLEVSIDPEVPVKSMREFPSAQMGGGDELYVYFLVNRGVTLVAVDAGKGHHDELNLVIPPVK